MPTTVRDLFRQLVPDPWRKATGFSTELETSNLRLFGPDVSASDCVKILNDWIQKYQPCLFGRLAAKLGLISYCLLNESDLLQSDDLIKKKIQLSRLEWTREAFEGRRSGFVIFVVSSNIANALPNDTMKLLACRLSSLYLLDDVSPDQILLDEIWLEKPGNRRTTWQWSVGVNYFSAQSDGRWWQDHRVPGGMAFSMNSVGHMAKSGAIAKAMEELDETLGSEDESWLHTKVDSLGDALEFAMRTISMASNAVSGKATYLLPLSEECRRSTECPADLPDFLREKDFCSYEGYYHTDITLPSEYFLPDVERPESIRPHSLDFSYLFREGADNPDFESMGTGRIIRSGKGKTNLTRPSKAAGISTSISRKSRLLQALEDR